MSAHQILAEIHNVVSRGDAACIDPGTGGTLALRNRWFSTFAAPAGTYKLPNSCFGSLVAITASGAVDIQDAAGNAVSSLQSGESCVYYAKSASSWAALEGAAAADWETLGDSFVDADNATWGTTATTLTGAMTELYLQHLTTQGHVDIPLSAFREVDADGDVGDTTANGGVLSSNTTPIYEGAGTTNAQRLNYATGGVDRIAASVTLPADFDGTAACTVDFIVASAGTTNSFNTAVLVTNWDGGADVTDALADTATTAVKAASATVTADGIPDAPLTVTVSLTPPTHATDALYIYGCRLRYQKKLLAS